MKKRTVIIYHKKKPLYVCEIKELESIDFLAIKKESETNLSGLITFYQNKEKALIERIEKLEKDVKVLKGEE